MPMIRRTKFVMRFSQQMCWINNWRMMLIKIQNSNQVRNFCIYMYQIDQKPEECQKSAKGKEYKGTAHVTEKGYTCQAWAAQSPHAHDYSATLGQESNYCRNPDDKDRPWCFTTSSRQEWDFCDIPLCGNNLKQHALRINISVICGYFTFVRCFHYKTSEPIQAHGIRQTYP